MPAQPGLGAREPLSWAIGVPRGAQQEAGLAVGSRPRQRWARGAHSPTHGGTPQDAPHGNPLTAAAPCPWCPPRLGRQSKKAERDGTAEPAPKGTHLVAEGNRARENRCVHPKTTSTEPREEGRSHLTPGPVPLSPPQPPRLAPWRPPLSWAPVNSTQHPRHGS